MQDSEKHKTSLKQHTALEIFRLISSFQSLDPPLSLLATTFRVDKDEQRMGVWHRADLLNDAHVLVISQDTPTYLTYS